MDGEALWGVSYQSPLPGTFSLLSSIQPRPLLKTFHSIGGYLEAKKLSTSQGSDGLRVAMRYANAAR